MSNKTFQKPSDVAVPRMVQVDVRRHKFDAAWSYAQLDQLQNELAAEQGFRLLLSEVSPVITLGKRSTDSDLLFPKRDYDERSIELYLTDRGGLATYHGPGQWVLFPLFPLEFLVGRRNGVRAAVEGLLEVAQKTAQAFGVESEIREGTQTGVWTAQGKLASVGIRVRHGVILHGLALNVYRTAESFFGVIPCGLRAPCAVEDRGSAVGHSASGGSGVSSESASGVGVALDYLRSLPQGVQQFEEIGRRLVQEFALKFNLDTQSVQF